MEWSGDGIICAVQRHGESGAVARLMTLELGLIGGYVRGGSGKRHRATLEVGNGVKGQWRARLAEHLGTLQVELTHPRAAALMASPLRLTAMSSVLALVAEILPAREPYPDIYMALASTLDVLEADAMPLDVVAAAIVRFELGLLSSLGFGLSLTHCAATGQSDDLIYVSPRTGRAVSREAGHDYKDRLYALPQFLLGSQAGDVDAGSLRDGLRLTGAFLEKWVLEPRGAVLPAARDRFISGLFSRLSAREAQAD